MQASKYNSNLYGVQIKADSENKNKTSGKLSFKKNDKKIN